MPGDDAAQLSPRADGTSPLLAEAHRVEQAPSHHPAGGGPRRAPPMASTWSRRAWNRGRALFGLPPQLTPDEQDDRTIYANNPPANRDFCDNIVITSKYTWYSFLPMFLFEQFTRFANAYFLLVSILQTIPTISITNGIPTNFLPLSIVLSFDGIVTAREDWKRHQDDARANASSTLVMRNGAFTPTLWRDVRVGDVLKIRRNEAVPADCVFLASYSPDADTPDTCYVQTAQLDGETSLKLRQALPATVERFRTDADVASFRGYIHCEPPNASFEKFIGTICLAPTAAVAGPAAGGARGGSYTAPGGSGGATGEQGISLTPVSSVRFDGPPLASASAGGGGSSSSSGSSSTHSVVHNPTGISSSGNALAQHHAPAGSTAGFAGAAAAGPAAAAAAVAASEDGRRDLPLEAEQILLRGSVMRNVDYAYGMVVYTGRETKVRVRQTSRVSKRAQVETEINRFIILLVCLLLAFCITGTAGAAKFHREKANADYLMLPGRSMSVLDGVRQTFTYFLLNASFIPVSLYVTVRLARSFQLFFMEKDAEMYHCEEDLVRATGGLDGQYPFKVRTMDLNDEIGQITHIFSDKTGTLTLNYMEFRKLLVGPVSYGLGTTQIGLDRMKREGIDTTALAAHMTQQEMRRQRSGTVLAARGLFSAGSGNGGGSAAGGGGDDFGLDGDAAASAFPSLPHVNYDDGSESHPGRTLAGDQRNPRDHAQGAALHNMMLHLALNHTVLPEVVRDNDGNIIGSRLSASSPDEEAFLFATETFGYKFHSRTHETITLQCKFPARALPLHPVGMQPPLPISAPSGGPAAGSGLRSPGTDPAARGGCHLTFRVLHILAYSQERKRMSVIVEHPCIDPATGEVVAGTGGEIFLYCKGADSVILPRLAPLPEDPAALAADPAAAAEAELRRFTKRTLADWGSDGLRTLVFAFKRLSQAETLAWSSAFTVACSDMGEVRKRKEKAPNRIDALMNEVEAGLTLQGATANEDKLQPQVPETIELLARAGIKTWMVTGDKQETAVNIGFATRLLDESMRQVVATVESAGDVRAAVKRIRVAAKRMAQERLVHEASSSKARGRIENLVEWMGDRVADVETTLGFAAPQSGVAPLPQSSVPGPAAVVSALPAAAAGDAMASPHAAAAGAPFSPSAAAAAAAAAASAGTPQGPPPGSATATGNARFFFENPSLSSRMRAGSGVVGSPLAGAAPPPLAAFAPMPTTAGASATGSSGGSVPAPPAEGGPTTVANPISAAAAAAASAADLPVGVSTGSGAAGGGATGVSSSPAAGASAPNAAYRGPRPSRADATTTGGTSLATMIGDMLGGGSRQRSGTFTGGGGSGARPRSDTADSTPASPGGASIRSGGTRGRAESFASEEGEEVTTGALDVPFMAATQGGAAGSGSGAPPPDGGSDGDRHSSDGAPAHSPLAGTGTNQLIINARHASSGSAGSDGFVVRPPPSPRRSGFGGQGAAGAPTSGNSGYLPPALLLPPTATPTAAGGNAYAANVLASGAPVAVVSVRGSINGGGSSFASTSIGGVSSSPAASSTAATGIMTSAASSRVLAALGSGDSASTAVAIADAYPASGSKTASTSVALNPTASGKAAAGAMAVLDQAALIARLTSPLLGPPPLRPYALVIDEPVLDAALAHEKTRAYLLYVSVQCAAVICCRARPDQKARVVKLIRDGVPSSRTLAVGDGANDVDMIRTAHVGVGIAGAEGVQAANASDYSIGRFRFLQRLLLVHGRWNYSRMSRLVLYTFYKNLIFVCAQFWFSNYNGFSGQKWFVEYGNQTYNLLYTALPLLLMGIYDRDVWDTTALKYPMLYEHGRTGRGLNVRVFLSWFFAAIVESLIIFFFGVMGTRVPSTTHAAWTTNLPMSGPGSWTLDGQTQRPLWEGNGATPFLFQMGTVVFAGVIAVVNVRVAMEIHTHFFLIDFLIFGSAILFLPACFLFDVMNDSDMRGGMRYVWGSPATWFTLLLIIVATGARMLTWKACKRLYRPTLRHIIQEAQSITHDYTDVDTFTEAADIARKTGKTVGEVFETARVMQAAAETVAQLQSKTPIPVAPAHGAGIAGVISPLAAHVAGKSAATAGTGVGSTTVAVRAGPGAAGVATIPAPPPPHAGGLPVGPHRVLSDHGGHVLDTTLLQSALFPSRRMRGDTTTAAYDPSSDFDHSSAAEANVWLASTSSSGAAGGSGHAASGAISGGWTGRGAPRPPRAGANLGAITERSARADDGSCEDGSDEVATPLAPGGTGSGTPGRVTSTRGVATRIASGGLVSSVAGGGIRVMGGPGGVRSLGPHRDSHPALAAELERAGLRVPSSSKLSGSGTLGRLGFGSMLRTTSSAGGAAAADAASGASYTAMPSGEAAATDVSGGDGSVGQYGSSRARASSDDQISTGVSGSGATLRSPEDGLASPKHAARGLSAAAASQGYVPPLLGMSGAAASPGGSTPFSTSSAPAAVAGTAGSRSPMPASSGSGSGYLTRIKSVETEDVTHSATSGRSVSAHAAVVSALAAAQASGSLSPGRSAGPYPAAGFSTTTGAASTGAVAGGLPPHRTHVGRTPSGMSEIGSSMSVDPAAAEYVSAHFSLFGPSTHSLGHGGSARSLGGSGRGLIGSRAAASAAAPTASAGAAAATPAGSPMLPGALPVPQRSRTTSNGTAPPSR